MNSFFSVKDDDIQNSKNRDFLEVKEIPVRLFLVFFFSFLKQKPQRIKQKSLKFFLSSLNQIRKGSLKITSQIFDFVCF